MTHAKVFLALKLRRCMWKTPQLKLCLTDKVSMTETRKILDKQLILLRKWNDVRWLCCRYTARISGDFGCVLIPTGRMQDVEEPDVGALLQLWSLHHLLDVLGPWNPCRTLEVPNWIYTNVSAPARHPSNKNIRNPKELPWNYNESHMCAFVLSIHVGIPEAAWHRHRIHCFISEPNFMGRQRQRHLGQCA